METYRSIVVKIDLEAFAHSLFNKFFPNSCPACQLPMDWKDYITDEELVGFCKDYHLFVIPQESTSLGLHLEVKHV